jgi:hypothetical protein
LISNFDSLYREYACSQQVTKPLIAAALQVVAVRAV